MDGFIFVSKSHKKFMFLCSFINSLDSRENRIRNSRIHLGLHSIQSAIISGFITLCLFFNFKFKLIPPPFGYFFCIAGCFLIEASMKFHYYLKKHYSSNKVQ